MDRGSFVQRLAEGKIPELQHRLLEPDRRTLAHARVAVEEREHNQRHYTSGETRLVHTVRGVGYVLRDES